MSNQKENLVIKTAINQVEIPEGLSEVPIILFDDRVMIEWIIPPKVLASGLYKPDQVKDIYSKGIVRSIGTGVFGNDSVLKVYKLNLGMTYYYFHQSAIEWDIIDASGEKKRGHLVRASDIFGLA